jgi:hypothetical protein
MKVVMRLPLDDFFGRVRAKVVEEMIKRAWVLSVCPSAPSKKYVRDVGSWPSARKD